MLPKSAGMIEMLIGKEGFSTVLSSPIAAGVAAAGVVPEKTSVRRRVNM